MVDETLRREGSNVVRCLSVHELSSVADVVASILEKDGQPGFAVPELDEFGPATVGRLHVGDVGVVRALSA